MRLRCSVVEQLTFAAGIDAIDLPQISCAHVEPPLRVEFQCPDVLCLGIEKDTRLSIRRNLVDLFLPASFSA